ncbi:hypothetical protein HY642_05605 [Candidatus Woesearchaeota archaeon]|nr:hypothetical protein [Candidatus Woesearchaeota archaeon]
MTKQSAFALVSLFFILSSAIAVQGFKWDTYQGVTQWRVLVVEDETGCGGSRKESTHTIDVQHSFEIVNVGDLGHGPTKGKFTGNIIHVTSRKIRDGSGYSTLTDFDIVFDDTCEEFGAKYYWDYQDSYSRCSGSTEWRGTKTGPTPGCPSVSFRSNIVDARSDVILDSKERKYRDVLAKDPGNFWANWDMAELKKKQGDGAEYFKYFNAALSNENIYQKTRAEMKQQALEKLQISAWPTRDKSPILRIEEQNIDQWRGGVVGAITIPPEQASDKSKWHFTLWSLLNPESQNTVNKIVGLPE